MLINRVLPIAALLVFAACQMEEPVRPDQDEPKAVESSFLSGIVTVQLDEATAAAVEQTLSQGENPATKAFGTDLSGLGIKSMRRVFPYAGEYEPRTRREGLHRFYYVEMDPSTPVTKATVDLGSIPGIVHVTPQFPVQPRAAYWNDPYFEMQWHLVNGRFQGADINVEKVWKEFTVGRADVIVSVVDAGVNMTHEDLAGNVIPCYSDGSGSFNFNNGTPTVVPSESHGTHVAGIISAINNNGIGVSSVAGGNAAESIPGVKIMSCQIFDLYGNQPDIYQAIKHGADHGAVILQCSWGFSPDLNGDGVKTDEEIALYRSYTIDDLPEYKAAIDYFIKYAGCDNEGNQLPDSPMKGGIAVFAAGNDNFDYDPLVSYDPIIAVSSFDMTGKKSSFSNWGNWIDIAAPGGETNTAIYSTIGTEGNGGYGGKDYIGTSMACPHVSGVAALLVSYFGGPGFTAEECRSRILRGAVSNYFTDTRYIGRKLDAYGAFTFDPSTPVVPPVLSWVGTPQTDLHYNQVVQYDINVQDPNGLRVHLELPADLNGVSLTSDGKVRVDAAALGQGEHTITIYGINEDGGKATLTLSVRVLYNFRPVATEAMPEGFILEGPEEELSINMPDLFTDPDGDDLVFDASVAHPEIAQVTLSDGQLNVKALTSGTTTLTLSAKDGFLDTTAQLNLIVKHPGSTVFLYPSSAVTNVNVVIDATEQVDMDITIYSASGAKVRQTQAKGDQMHPVTVFVNGLAPGLYTLKASYSGNSHSMMFSKK